LAGKEERPALVRDNFGSFFSRDAIVYLEQAQVCSNCGYARLYADPDKLRRALLRRENAAPSEA
jgi:hypothetical protein